MATVGAIITNAPEDGKMKWEYGQIPAPRQPKEREVLVRMVASGICHTDIFMSHLPPGTLGASYPRILGHEGAGYVEAIGSAVKSVAVGDPVLLSYNRCASCDLCNTDQHTYCEDWGLLNVVPQTGIYKSAEDEGPAGNFFGQSSFASKSIVAENSVVNVKEHLQTFEELKRCAPLGCGLMTGAGCAYNRLTSIDILLVTGLGAVGMGAIMAAKQVGVRAIIAVDRVENRLNIAKDFGATHLYNTSGKELSSFVEDVRALVDGKRISCAIETTGFGPLIDQAILALGKRGKFIQIGIPNMESTINLPMMDFYNQNKTFEVNYLGDAKPQEFIPKMIQWYKEGKFPIDRIIKFFRTNEIDEALEAMHAEVIKPIIVF